MKCILVVTARDLGTISVSTCLPAVFQNKPAPCAVGACGSPVNFCRTVTRFAVNFGSYECLEIMGQDLGKTSRLLSKRRACPVGKIYGSFITISDLQCSCWRYSAKRRKERIGDESRSSVFYGWQVLNHNLGKAQ